MHRCHSPFSFQVPIMCPCTLETHQRVEHVQILPCRTTASSSMIVADESTAESSMAGPRFFKPSLYARNYSDCIYHMLQMLACNPVRTDCYMYIAGNAGRPQVAIWTSNMKNHKKYNRSLYPLGILCTGRSVSFGLALRFTCARMLTNHPCSCRQIGISNEENGGEYIMVYISMRYYGPHLLLLYYFFSFGRMCSYVFSIDVFLRLAGISPALCFSVIWKFFCHFSIWYLAM